MKIIGTLWTDDLKSGKILEHGQDSNGVQYAQIRGIDGLIESCLTAKTPNEVGIWLKDHKEEIAPPSYYRGEALSVTQKGEMK